MLAGGRVRRFVPQHNGSPASYSDVLRGWQEDEEFRSFFLSLLTNAEFGAYRWETPPITAATAGREFEFVLIDTPALDQPADLGAFADQFSAESRSAGVVAFPNLGNDAVLVVPCPSGPKSEYAHLAAFVRNAPAEQKHELCRVVGQAMHARLGKDPLWLSTAGMGVPWLHVRLDSRPKYYAFAPYRQGPRTDRTSC